MNIAPFIILLFGTLVCSLDDDLIKEMEKSVKYHLCTRKNPYGSIKLGNDNMDGINKNTPTKVIIHGKASNIRLKFVQDITAEYLKKGDYNVIQLNWERLAYEPYPIIASQVHLLGIVIARFLTKLYDNEKLLPSYIHVIGHSTGAEVSGYAGKEFYNLTGLKISRITALDPLSPRFESKSFLTKEILKQSAPEHGPVYGIERTAADIVDAIHTDSCVFGGFQRVGIVDFYLNGGEIQPDCPKTCSVDGLSQFAEKICNGCNHLISIMYFNASINSRKFVSTKCNSWKDYKNDKCKNNLKILMGDDYRYSPEATGKFYLQDHL